MPRDNKVLRIPGGDSMSINRKTHNLKIHAHKQCQWCYSDPDGVFPTLLASGTIAPGEYGPYEATGNGAVTFGDPESGDCDPSGGSGGTPHTITVTS
jgi:hypothetical protein